MYRLYGKGHGSLQAQHNQSLGGNRAGICLEVTMLAFNQERQLQESDLGTGTQDYTISTSSYAEQHGLQPKHAGPQSSQSSLTN